MAGNINDSKRILEYQAKLKFRHCYCIIAYTVFVHTSLHLLAVETYCFPSKHSKNKFVAHHWKTAKLLSISHHNKQW